MISFIQTPASIASYYRFHSIIYDSTRWSFLFGRSTVINLTAQHCRPASIMEIGCGTGRNLSILAERFPDARITGIDLSADMLQVAKHKLAPHGTRITLLNAAYHAPLAHGSFDLVLASYALSMFNPGWDAAIESAYADLRQGGIFALVDFHDSPSQAFKRWMGINHVRMDGHLAPKIGQQFKQVQIDLKCAYAGLWRYMIYLGSKR